MVTQIWVSIGSGNGLMPDGTKPLPEQMLINYQWGLPSFSWEQFHRKCSRYLFMWVYKLHNITVVSLRGQWVNLPTRLPSFGCWAVLVKLHGFEIFILSRYMDHSEWHFGRHSSWKWKWITINPWCAKSMLENMKYICISLTGRPVSG